MVIYPYDLPLQTCDYYIKLPWKFVKAVIAKNKQLISLNIP